MCAYFGRQAHQGASEDIGHHHIKRAARSGQRPRERLREYARSSSPASSSLASCSSSGAADPLRERDV
jgi:hypothetical protein